MDTVLLLARLILTCIFGIAGLAKLFDHSGSRQALIDFGFPVWAARPAGLLLPITELVIAVTLIPPTTARWGAAGALILLLLFCVGIGISLAHGRTLDCHCFGQLHSALVGWLTLLRNCLLAMVAGFIVWQGQSQADLRMVSGLNVLTIRQWVVLVGIFTGIGLLFFNLLQKNRRLRLRIEVLENHVGTDNIPSVETRITAQQGLIVGTPAPPFQLRNLFGETISLDTLQAFGPPIMLVFVDPDCGSCVTLLPKLAWWQHEYTDILTIAPISCGTVEANQATVAAHELTLMLLQYNLEVAQAYHVPGTPAAVLIHPDGFIGSPLVLGTDAIESLIVDPNVKTTNRRK